mmetsp:Transcript_16126/g.47331  ORF Transcript_16126/g.47331 Transcript_16126/m.47331 type:complete len:214 (-) Transcript_16126:1081-1722(-)
MSTVAVEEVQFLHERSGFLGLLLLLLFILLRLALADFGRGWRCHTDGEVLGAACCSGRELCSATAPGLARTLSAHHGGQGSRGARGAVGLRLGSGRSGLAALALVLIPPGRGLGAVRVDSWQRGAPLGVEELGLGQFKDGTRAVVAEDLYAVVNIHAWGQGGRHEETAVRAPTKAHGAVCSVAAHLLLLVHVPKVHISRQVSKPRKAKESAVR